MIRVKTTIFPYHNIQLLTGLDPQVPEALHRLSGLDLRVGESGEGEAALLRGLHPGLATHRGVEVAVLPGEDGVTRLVVVQLGLGSEVRIIIITLLLKLSHYDN